MVLLTFKTGNEEEISLNWEEFTLLVMYQNGLIVFGRKGFEYMETYTLHASCDILALIEDADKRLKDLRKSNAR